MKNIILSILFSFITFILADYCGESKIPSGIEVDQNGRLSLSCTKPSCFKKSYSDCEERAFKRSCQSETSWVGGITNYAPRIIDGFYLQCCEFEQLPSVSRVIKENLIVRPGEYYDGEEILDDIGDELVSFDLISDISKNVFENNTIYYKVKVVRFYCDKLVKIAKPHNNWPYFDENE
uniref:3D domain-containing protein n=1 Tax=Parastrongyloides trichosuri TaxID=131310 RepID=A0A0N4ZHT7_PARTI